MASAPIVTYLGFPLMLALLVFVHYLARRLFRRRLLAIAVGAFASYLTCVLLFFVSMAGMGVEKMTLRVSVIPARPAHEAGLRDGDLLVAINGISLTAWDELRAIIQESGDSPLDLEVEREGLPLRFKVQPRDGQIGVSPIVERHALPIGITAATAMAAPVFTIAEWARSLTEPRVMMGPVAIIEREPSLWPWLFRFGELGSYAWPFSMLIAFFLSRKG